MDGLKAIAQSTFDKLQQFRPSGNPGGGSHSHSNNNTNNPGGPNHTGANPGDGDSGPYRYNVVEIGAFGPAPSSLVSNPGLRRQQSSSTPNLATNGGTSRQSVGGGGGSTPASAGGAASSSTTVRRVTMNEWMVFEDDLAAFMKKRPVDYVTVATEPQENTTSNTAKKGSSKSQASTRKEEVEAFASLKLVCIQRIDPHDDNQDEEEEEDDDDDVEEEYYLDDGEDNVEDDYRRHLKDYQRQNQPPRLQPETNTLAISRDTFLRLYVTLMDGDHSALYYLAREYDGFHEFNDANKGITTKYVGTADYALLWTFNRRTLETRGLFIDRCQRWQAKDSFPLLTAALSGGPEPSRLSTLSSDGLILSRSAVQRTSSTAAQHPGSPPVTPVTPNNTHRSTSRQLYTHLEHNHNQSHASRLHDASSVHSTPSRRWTKNRTGSVTASEAWRGFRETLSIYRSYVFVPQLLSFVSVVHMLRAFDDQLNDEDLPLIKSVEATLVGNVQRNSRVGVPGGGKHRRGMRQSSRSVAGFDPASSSFYAGSPSASRYGRGGTGGEDGRHGNANLHAASSRINSIMMPSQTTNFSLVSEPNNNQTKNAFAPSTPPAEAADKSEQQPQATSGPSRPGTATGPPAGQTPQQAAQAAQIAQAQAHAAAQATAQAQAAAITALAARDKLLAQAVLLSRVDTSLANKRRHLDLARKLLEVLTQEHETLFVDVVAPLYLDRYHRAMEGLAEAVPALERHVASLDDFLCYLKGRAETLSGLISISAAITATAGPRTRHPLQQVKSSPPPEDAPRAPSDMGEVGPDLARLQSVDGPEAASHLQVPLHRLRPSLPATPPPSWEQRKREQGGQQLVDEEPSLQAVDNSNHNHTTSKDKDKSQDNNSNNSNKTPTRDHNPHDNVAGAALASMPAIFSAATIAIVSLNNNLSSNRSSLSSTYTSSYPSSSFWVLCVLSPLFSACCIGSVICIVCPREYRCGGGAGAVFWSCTKIAAVEVGIGRILRRLEGYLGR